MENVRNRDSARIIPAIEQPAPSHPLVEPSLFYAPPYERPLEDEFAWHLVKYLDPASALGYKVKVRTPVMNLWIDFVVENGPRRIGFECSDLYDDDTELTLRDALVIGSGAVDTLYRLRGTDVLYRLHDCLHLVARWDPTLFSRRGLINLDTLASTEARARFPRTDEVVLTLDYPVSEQTDQVDGDEFTWADLSQNQNNLTLKRLSRSLPSAWIRDYDRALKFFGVSDDDLGAQWAKSA